MKKAAALLPGEQYGWWEVLRVDPATLRENLEPGVYRQIAYFCRCRCGAVSSVQRRYLVDGRSTKCSRCAALTRKKRQKPTRVEVQAFQENVLKIVRKMPAFQTSDITPHYPEISEACVRLRLMRMVELGLLERRGRYHYTADPNSTFIPPTPKRRHPGALKRQIQQVQAELIEFVKQRSSFTVFDVMQFKPELSQPQAWHHINKLIDAGVIQRFGLTRGRRPKILLGPVGAPCPVGLKSKISGRRLKQTIASRYKPGERLLVDDAVAMCPNSDRRVVVRHLRRLADSGFLRQVMKGTRGKKRIHYFEVVNNTECL